MWQSGIASPAGLSVTGVTVKSCAKARLNGPETKLAAATALQRCRKAVARMRSNIPMATVVLAGTLDTKHGEYAFVRSRLRDVHGLDTVLVDVGIVGCADPAADITRDEVARAAGKAAMTNVQPLSLNSYKVELFPVAIYRTVLLAAGQMDRDPSAAG